VYYETGTSTFSIIGTNGQILAFTSYNPPLAFGERPSYQKKCRPNDPKHGEGPLDLIIHNRNKEKVFPVAVSASDSKSKVLRTKSRMRSYPGESRYRMRR